MMIKDIDRNNSTDLYLATNPVKVIIKLRYLKIK